MKIHLRLPAIAFACLAMATACSKDKTTPPEPSPVEDATTITPIGTAVGNATKKTIGTTGGEIISPDGKIQISIPAGALAANKEISIQAITNELPDGIGNAYRLLPHGEQFSKPVTITFNYKQEDLKTTLPEFLDIAFQDADGTWAAISNPAIDKNNKKVSVTTTHFSDWTFFKSLMLIPNEATVALNGGLDLKVITHFPYMDPDDAAPGTNPIKLLKNPRELREHEMKGWSYNGKGILLSYISRANYTAPSEEPAANPEVVTANIRLARKGQFMLLCNITVLSKYTVRYLQVDEDYKSPLNNGNCALYIYGSFGNDPGDGKRTIKIGGVTAVVNLWTPTLIRCWIDRDVAGEIDIAANGKSIAKSLLKKYTGTFLYQRFHGGVINAGSSNALKESTEFKIVYRGFGSPMPEDLSNPFSLDQIGAFGTRADYTLSGSASVTTPGACPITNSVSLAATSGTILMNTITGTDALYTSDIKEKAGGIEVTIEFYVNNVMTNVKVHYSNCNFSGDLTPKTLGVSFAGFDRKPISLAFSGSDKLIIAGTGELKSQRLSSDILIDAWDGTGSPSHYESDGLVPATLKNK